MITAENTKYHDNKRHEYQHEGPLKFSWFLVFILVVFSVLPSAGRAASLTFVSDTISTSRSGVGADHTIRLTATNLVPVSGKIVITPQAGFFTVPSGLDYTDIDLLISGVQNSLGATPTSGQSGVAVVGGATPRIIITLSSNTFIPPASSIIIKIGKNAAHEIVGDQQITNSSTTGSYKIAVETRNSLDATIDNAFGMVAITNPVSVGTGVSQATASATFSFTAGGSTTLTNINNSTVVFSFPQDSYTEDLELQANSYANNFFITDKPVLSGKSFAGKTYDFNLFTASGSIVSATLRPITMVLGYTDTDISGLDESTLAPYRWGVNDSAWQLISGGTVDTANNKIIFSTTLFNSFALFASPAPPAPPPPAPSGGGGGGGGGGLVASIEAPAIHIGIPDSAFVSPVSGAAIVGTNADGSSIRLNIPAGFWTFASTFTITTISQKTAASVAPVPFNLFILGDQIYGIHAKDTNGNVLTEFLKPVALTLNYTDAQGSGFEKKTLKIYSLNQTLKIWEVVRGSSVYVDFPRLYGSISTPTLFAIMGSSPSPVSRVGDFNQDGRVDLVDFSIMLYNWGVPKNPITDINNDGKVDLVDFSILLYWWTG